MHVLECCRFKVKSFSKSKKQHKHFIIERNIRYIDHLGTNICVSMHIRYEFLNISYIYFWYKVFYWFLLLGRVFILNLQYYNICIQHHLYTIFEKISSLSLFVFSHTQLQRVTIITKKAFFIFHISCQEDVCIGICSSDNI